MTWRLAALTAMFAGSLAMTANELLLEAESFGDKGGWAVDQQFVEQMGSPYLLAHGLGKPVANAVTTAEFPSSGTYRVWVRTKNWVPGDWDAPGRFRVKIDGKLLSTVFGTEPGWNWQDGGTCTIASATVQVELQDMAGFDGRCDALYFTQDLDARPPNDLSALARWRGRLLGMPETPPLAGTFDVVVVGGGISGCAAAIAAGEQGMKVALIHDRPILGGNASGEIRVHTIGIHGNGARILKTIDTEHWPNGSARALADDKKRHNTMTTAKGVSLFLSCRAYGVATDGKRITAVNARHIESGLAQRFEAPLFIDTTGDGWIGYWAGAEYSYGRESRNVYGENWDKHGSLWSPTEPDNRVMGTSLLWYSKVTDSPKSFPNVPWAMDVAKDKVAVAGEWFWEYSSDDKHQIHDAEAIRDHVLRAIYGSFANAKTRDQYAKHELSWVGFLGGKRESRRLVGDYIFTMQDAITGRHFEDSVATETRALDVHFQRILDEKWRKTNGQDFLSEALFRHTPRYYIPFRTLYSKNITNLMMAGRCFSCSHVGLGGPRVMLTCGQMGIATGYAASLCKKHAVSPRDVGRTHIAELRALIGADQWGPNPLQRTTSGEHAFDELPKPLAGLRRITVLRGASSKPAPAYNLTINQPATLYLAVHDRGTFTPPAPWTKTDLKTRWGHHSDTVYSANVPAGTVKIPGHTGSDNKVYGLPHVVFVAPGDKAAGTLKIEGIPADLAPIMTSP